MTCWFISRPSPRLGRRPPKMEDGETACAPAPSSAVGLRLAIGEHRNGPLHAYPSVAVTMLETRILLAQHAEFCRLNHQDLR